MATVRQLVEEDGRQVLRTLNPPRCERVLTSDNETMIRSVVVFRGERV